MIAKNIFLPPKTVAMAKTPKMTSTPIAQAFDLDQIHDQCAQSIVNDGLAF